MQTKNPCEEYLDSREIIRIIQSNNETFINKIFGCITASKAVICDGIVLKHPKIATDLLILLRDDVFQQAQIIFLEEVRRNRFKPVTSNCIPFLKKIFRNEYYREYQKEILREERRANGGEPLTEEMSLEFQDNLTLKVNKLLQQLGPTDREIYRLRYMEALKNREIAPLLQISADAVTKQLTRLHQRLRSLW